MLRTNDLIDVAIPLDAITGRHDAPLRWNWTRDLNRFRAQNVHERVADCYCIAWPENSNASELFFHIECEQLACRRRRGSSRASEVSLAWLIYHDCGANTSATGNVT